MNKIKENAIIHYPNLKTVLMVEKILKKSNNLLTRKKLKELLPKKIMHQTLNIILQYLEESNKIFDGRKGILWIHNKNKKLQNLINQGIKV